MTKPVTRRMRISLTYEQSGETSYSSDTLSSVDLRIPENELSKVGTIVQSYVDAIVTTANAVHGPTPKPEPDVESIDADVTNIRDRR